MLFRYDRCSHFGQVKRFEYVNRQDENLLVNILIKILCVYY